MDAAKELARRSANFRSVDSRPGGLAVPVSILRAPALLLTFTIISVAQLAVFELGWLDDWFPARDYVFGPYDGGHAISIRTFILSFYIAFSAFAAGTVRARVEFGLDLVLRFLVICALLDLCSTALFGLIGEPYPLGVLQVIAGLLGFGIFSFVILERGTMPESVPVRIDRQFAMRSLIRLAVTGLVAAILSVWAGFHDLEALGSLREAALLGGIGPGVVLFLFLLFVQLYVIATVERQLLSREDFAAPLSVIVPAHNEAYVIEETILQIERAARQYAAPVELIVLDNASTDDTAEIARKALAECETVQGRVVHVARPGKAHALNTGVAAARHDYIVRIDADTQIGPESFRLTMQNFAHANTGAVGGVPIPPGGAQFDGGRLVEVLLKHSYYSPGLTAITGLVDIPGMFVIYRAEALRRAGAFAAGMNGEDTDISLRIAELGFRTLVDERVRYVSEVPTSFAHLREQRLRWFRSIYHVSSRARTLILSPRVTIRGKLILPYMLMNNARRAMTVPILIFGLFELLLTRATNTQLSWQAVAAVVFGSPMLVAVIAIALAREPRALLSLPSYAFFRGLRAWYTLESALTIPINTRPHTIRLPETAIPPSSDIPPLSEHQETS